MNQLEQKISVWENGLEKQRKELRKYRYPSKKYLHTEWMIRSIEKRLKKMYNQRNLKTQLELF